MKKLFPLVAVILISSCGAASRGMMGSTKKKLIQTVAIEVNCPQDSIQITNSVTGYGSATYEIMACGQRYVYKLVGTVFMKADDVDKAYEEFLKSTNKSK